MDKPYLCYVTWRPGIEPAQLAVMGRYRVAQVQQPRDTKLLDFWTEVYRACFKHVPEVIVLDVDRRFYHRLLLKINRLAPAVIIVRPETTYDSENSIERDVFKWSGGWQQMTLVDASIRFSEWMLPSPTREAGAAANGGERTANAHESADRAGA